MATTISSLISFVTAHYPTIDNAIPQFFNAQFRAISKAITSCQDVTKAGQLGVTVVSATPTTSNLAAGQSGVFKVTGGAVYLAYNDAGVIKKVALT